MTLQEKAEILTHLETFLEELEYYKYSRLPIISEKLPPRQVAYIGNLRNKLLRDVGRLRPLIMELVAREEPQIVPEGALLASDLWIKGLELQFSFTAVQALDYCIDLTNVAIGKLEDDIRKGIRDAQGNILTKEKKQSETVVTKPESLIQLFDTMQLHKKVVEASRKLFEDGHYAQAIFEAYKSVENYIKKKSGSNLYGKQLMATVFNEEKPIIQVPEAGYLDKDVQEGFKFLFMGASQGIRNPKAHLEIVQKDPYITLEYLGFASFLLKRISYLEAGTT